jgi:HSP20 family molecular chaperone IbpA
MAAKSSSKRNKKIDKPMATTAFVRYENHTIYPNMPVINDSIRRIFRVHSCLTLSDLDAQQLASYVTPNNMLIIELPIRNPEVEHRLAQSQPDPQTLAQFGAHRDPLFDYAGFLSGSDFRPRIVDKGNREKQLELTVPMKNYKPDEIKVSVKNNELIVQGEHRYKDDNRSERSFFFKSTTLPPGTQVDQLQSQLTDDGQLKIEAPFIV